MYATTTQTYIAVLDQGVGENKHIDSLPRFFFG